MRLCTTSSLHAWSRATRLGDAPHPGRPAASGTAQPGTARLDVELVRRGLLRSRAAAAEAIAHGRVRVAGRVAAKASARVASDSVIEVDDPGWVSRSAEKLDVALDTFPVDPADRLALDVGASTGGFTQVLLRRGVRRVVALDVGHGQLADSVRADPRVRAVEGRNARDLEPSGWPDLAGTGELPTLVVADVSFISLRLVLPAVASIVAPAADLVVLIKPQFEVGRSGVRGGIVREPRLRAIAIADVLGAAWQHGLGASGLIPSPIVGEHGNIEAVAWLTAGGGLHPTEWASRIDAVSEGT